MSLSGVREELISRAVRLVDGVPTAVCYPVLAGYTNRAPLPRAWVEMFDLKLRLVCLETSVFYAFAVGPAVSLRVPSVVTDPEALGKRPVPCGGVLVEGVKERVDVPKGVDHLLLTASENGTVIVELGSAT